MYKKEKPRRVMKPMDFNSFISAIYGKSPAKAEILIPTLILFTSTKCKTTHEMSHRHSIHINIIILVKFDFWFTYAKKELASCESSCFSYFI